jgi:hypothetical protein
MKRRKTVLLSLLALLLVAGSAAGFLTLFYHVPGFYVRCEIPPGAERSDLSERCFGKLVTELFNRMSNNGPDYAGPWKVDFTERELNAFLQEDVFSKWPDAKSLERQGISDLRVAFEADNHIRLGFRYGKKPWQTIMSFDMRVWLVPKETNVLVVELVARRAGALPVSAQSLLTLIAEQFHSKYVDISWYRRSGNPVALVRFQSDSARPNFQLRRISVDAGRNGGGQGEGMLTLGGMSFDPNKQLP